MSTAIRVNDGSRVHLRLAALSGLASVALFTAAWVAAGLFERDYDGFRQDISDFGALNASHPLPYNAALSLSGLLTVPLAVGLWTALGRGLTARLGSAALLVFGVGQLLDGLLREDCSPSGDEACRHALDAGQLSWHHEAHDIETLLTFSAIILAPLLLAFAFRRVDRFRDLYPWSLAASAVTLLSTAWYFVLYASGGGPYSGILERFLIASAGAWIVLVSLRLHAVARG
jgi:hypothetical membrane protein